MSPRSANSAFTDHASPAFAMDPAPARINRFVGINIHTWKFKMQIVLEERDVWEVISGEVKLEQC